MITRLVISGELPYWLAREEQLGISNPAQFPRFPLLRRLMLSPKDLEEVRIEFPEVTEDKV